MLDHLYLQQGEHALRSSISATRGALCKILYICKKGSTYVRKSCNSSILLSQSTKNEQILKYVQSSIGFIFKDTQGSMP